MEIQISQKFCILTPLSHTLDKRQVLRLKEEISKYSDYTIGIDLNFVEDCTFDFIEILQSIKASCFNIHSDIFSVFNIMNIDKTVPLYSSEDDFKADKHRLLNRKFCVIKN